MANKIQTFRIIISVIFFGLFLFLLGKTIYQPRDAELPNSLVGENAPHFHLQNIIGQGYPFTEHSFKGHLTLLNVWASWCSACMMEHPFLMEIQKNYHIPIYGIAYKDDLLSIQSYLSEEGNPYDVLGNDTSGETSLEFGVYGTPETFLINKDGKIVYRHVGVMSKEIFQEELLPIIKKLQ